MNDIVQKLLRDLKRRLRGKKRERPGKQELERWGVTRIPTVVPLLLYGAYLAFALLGPKDLFNLPAWLSYMLFAWPGWVFFFVALQSLQESLNSYLVVSAYKRLLMQYERFTLVEYCKYLERQVERATKDQTLGGQNEVKRLKQLHSKLLGLLQKGVGKDVIQLESELSREADLAAAVIETYEVVDEDLFKGLDDRLPSELRQRIEELDQEADRQRRRETD